MKPTTRPGQPDDPQIIWLRLQFNVRNTDVFVNSQSSHK